MKNSTHIIMLSIVTTVAQAGFQSPGTVQMMDAQIKTTDGNTETINNVNINGTTEFMAFAKPLTVKSQTATEIVVEANPRNNETKQTLSTIKNVVFKNKQTAYVYQEKDGMKHKFYEIEIDGSPFLIPSGWKLHGKNTGNKDRSISFDSIEKISITSVYTKGNTTEEGQCVCPIPKWLQSVTVRL